MSAETLLIGGGYTLSRLAKVLAPGSFIITSTTPEKVKSMQAQGWRAELLDISSLRQIDEILARNPGVKKIVDSVPPVPGNRGVLNIREASENAGIRRILYLGTTGVYGEQNGGWVDEDTPVAPDNERSLARAESERIYADSAVPSVVFRIAAIYGPGRGIGNALKKGTYSLIQGRDRWSNRIHVDDLVSAICGVIRYPAEKELPPVVCISDDKPSLTSEVVNFYCRTFSLKPPAEISPEQAKERKLHSLVSNQRVSNRLLKKVLGLRLKYPSFIEGAATEFEL